MSDDPEFPNTPPPMVKGPFIPVTSEFLADHFVQCPDCGIYRGLAIASLTSFGCTPPSP